MGVAADERRIRKLAASRLEPDEQIVALARAWVSRRVRAQPFALRARHVVVVTSARLMLFSVGYWSRRPRRRVFAEPLASLTVGERDRRRPALVVHVPGGRALLVELGSSETARRVADALARGAARPRGEPAAGGAGSGAAPASPDSITRPPADPAHPSTRSLRPGGVGPP
jgi:hypothetical protein